VKKALKRGGIVSVQSGSFGAQPKLVRLIQKRLHKVFKYVEVRRACIQTYSVGEYAFTMASDTDFRKTTRRTLERKFKHKNFKDLKYWSPDMHRASAVLPEYLKE